MVTIGIEYFIVIQLTEANGDNVIDNLHLLFNGGLDHFFRGVSINQLPQLFGKLPQLKSKDERLNHFELKILIRIIIG